MAPSPGYLPKAPFTSARVTTANAPSPSYLSKPASASYELRARATSCEGGDYGSFPRLSVQGSLCKCEGDYGSLPKLPVPGSLCECEGGDYGYGSLPKLHVQGCKLQGR